MTNQNESKHTPGPWISHGSPRIGTESHMGYCIQAGKMRGILIADLNPGTSSDRISEVCEANARLIASAPELLEVCKAMLNSVGADLDTAYESARAAIQKAEGR